MKQMLSSPCSIGRGLATRRLQNPGIVRKGDFLPKMRQNFISKSVDESTKTDIFCRNKLSSTTNK